MKRKTAGTQPLVHCPLVPNWGDEFDLRLYFACIHPGQYELRSEGDRVLATQLLAAVVAYAVNHVGIYRAAIRAAARGDVLKAVVQSMRALRRLGEPGYSDWFQKPQAGFSGLSPFAWFQARELPELAQILRLKSRVEDHDVFGEIPLTEELGTPDQPWAPRAKGHLDLGRKSSPAASVDTVLLTIAESSCPGPDWDDEFALTPYFARWSPWNYELGTPVNYRLAQEIYGSAMGEFAGWVTLYRTALQTSIHLDGGMEMVVRCCMKIVELGLPRYLEWFGAPQPEFNGLSPERWFQEKRLSELERLLKGSR